MRIVKIELARKIADKHNGSLDYISSLYRWDNIKFIGVSVSKLLKDTSL
jgi:hypothetical protein